jgi:hypothetical protein
LKFTPTDLPDLIVTLVLTTSVLIGTIAVALRLAVRPLLADWVKFRSEAGRPPLEQRIAEMEEDIRQLKAGAGLQLPAESLRASSHSRT